MIKNPALDIHKKTDVNCIINFLLQKILFNLHSQTNNIMIFFSSGKKIIFSFFVFLLFAPGGLTQEKGVFSGGFETNANIFLRDSSINAINTPQYDRQKFGGEGLVESELCNTRIYFWGSF
jgi:hypothetical protein